MNIYISDPQDITCAGIQYVCDDLCHMLNQQQHPETASAAPVCRRALDKTALLALLQQDQDAVVILDFTLFDINDADELMILHERFPLTRWVLFSVDLSCDFVRRMMLSPAFSVVLKESPFHTVNTHRKNIFRKLGVNTIHEATKYALRAGLIDASDYYI